MRGSQRERERDKKAVRERRGTLEWECVTRAFAYTIITADAQMGTGILESQRCYVCVRRREGAVSLHLCVSFFMLKDHMLVMWCWHT